MPINLLISSPVTGKTSYCLSQIKGVFKTAAFARVCILVPDQLQAVEIRGRLARLDVVLPVGVITFRELHEQILEQAGKCLPVAENEMLHQLLQELIHSLADNGQLKYYTPICDLPGFIQEIDARIAELKRALVTPERFLEVAQAHTEPGLIDLARIYSAYQSRLQNLGWADLEGLGWLAYQALEMDQNILADLAFLLVDGFDNFNPAQMRFLQILANRAAQTWVTLPGTPTMDRIAHQRFSRVVQDLSNKMRVDIHTLDSPPHLPPTLHWLEANLFVSQPQPILSGKDFLMIEARSPAEEAREGLRWIKERIIRDGLQASSCAVVVPELDLYRASLSAAADEFGLPLRFSQREVVSSTPAAAALADLLGLVINDFPLSPLLDTIRSPYFNLKSLGLTHNDARLLKIASQYGQVVHGIHQWEDTLHSLAALPPAVEIQDVLDEEGFFYPSLPTAANALRLWKDLHALAARLAPPTGLMSMKEWTIWLENLLNSLEFFQSISNCDETDLCSSFEHLLSILASSEELTGPIPSDYAGFVKDFLGLLSVTSVLNDQHDDPQGAIRVMRILEARGLRVDALVLLGLAEGIFPAVERTDPFLSEDLRKELGMELRLGQEQTGLFFQVATRADRFLLMTRPYLAKDGEIWEPSPYWIAAEELFLTRPTRIHPDDPRPLTEAASSNELLFWASRRLSQSGLELPASFLSVYAMRWKHVAGTRSLLASRLKKADSSIYDGDLSALIGEMNFRFGKNAVWSASRLETYATCPFYFLAASGLELEILETPELGFQANQLGTLLHAVLEQVFREASNPLDTASVLLNLPDVAMRIFKTAPIDYQFRPSVLWDTQQSELILVLKNAIQKIADIEPEMNWRPLEFEARFGLEGKPPLKLFTPAGEIRLHGIIDRIDINSKGTIRVIDYKSGGSHLTAQDLIDGRRLQLPVYALAASQSLGLGQAVEGFYWKLMQGEASALKLSRFKCETGTGPRAAFKTAVEHIVAIVTGIQKGDFAPFAPKGGCPSYCPASSWCWHFVAGVF